MLNDTQIRERSINSNMIIPFNYQQRKDSDDNKVISYGLSSYGYDVRLSPTIAVPVEQTVLVDPKDDSTIRAAFKEIELNGSPFYMPPHSFALGYTVETFNMPNDVFGICIGKSTYARLGLDILVSPIEPGFKGQVVIEITNNTSNTVVIYPNEGICQFVFFEGDPAEVNYSNRENNYQGQKGLCLATVK